MGDVHNPKQGLSSMLHSSAAQAWLALICSWWEVLMGRIGKLGGRWGENGLDRLLMTHGRLTRR